MTTTDARFMDLMERMFTPVTPPTQPTQPMYSWNHLSSKQQQQHRYGITGVTTAQIWNGW